MPPVPNVSVKNDVPEAQKETAPAAAGDGDGKKKKMVFVAAAVLALLSAVGGFIGVRKLLAPKPVPAPQAKAKAGSSTVATPSPKQGTTPSTKAPAATASNTAQPTPSDPMNKIAHAPKAAINKAQ